MSDLREKVAKKLCALDGYAAQDRLYRIWADHILALVERSAVERERKAFVEGWHSAISFATYYSRHDPDPVHEADRRYPLPKEE